MKDLLTQGETLFAQGKIREAEKCFAEVSKLEPGNCEALNNLGVIAFQRQDQGQALDYFTQALQMDPCNKTALLNCACLLNEMNLGHEILSALEKAVQRSPDDPDLIEVLKDIQLHQHPKPTLAIACLPGFESFLPGIVDSLDRAYDVRCCTSDSKKEIESVVASADIVWLEWANELAIALTNESGCLGGKRVICRLHSYEAFDGYAAQVRWEKVSDLIFVAQHIKDFVLQQVPDLLSRVKNVHVVPNGVNLDRFPFRDRSKGKDLAYLGSINFKKGPMLLLHALRALVEEDSGYRLFIGGNFQEPRYALYFSQMVEEMGLQKNIEMAGWIDNVPAWLEDKQYIVCTSLLEGHPVGLMEAMACGLKPIIHNFVGARGSYPEPYLWNTIPEFVRMVTQGHYDPREYRTFVEQNFSLKTQTERIERIITAAK